MHQGKCLIAAIMHFFIAYRITTATRFPLHTKKKNCLHNPRKKERAHSLYYIARRHAQGLDQLSISNRLNNSRQHMKGCSDIIFFFALQAAQAVLKRSPYHVYETLQLLSFGSVVYPLPVAHQESGGDVMASTRAPALQSQLGRHVFSSR